MSIDITEAGPIEGDTPGRSLRIQMDPDAVDAAGRAMMTSATLLRGAFATAAGRLDALLSGPETAAEAHEWAEARTGAERWMTHMHQLGTLIRECAAGWTQTETDIANNFHRQREELAASMTLFRQRRAARLRGDQPPPADSAETAGDGA